MSAVVFPETPVSVVPEQSLPETGSISSLVKSVVYYGLLLGGLLFPIAGGLVGLIAY